MYGIKYVINHQIFKKNTPLICGLVISNRCNLHCRHCKIAERGMKDLSFEEAITVLNSFYEEGGRTVYMEGGELPGKSKIKKHNMSGRGHSQFRI